MLTVISWQRHLGKVDSRYSRAVVAVMAEFFGDFDADIFLSFLGRPSNMRRKETLVQTSQRRDELVIVRARLDWKYINGCTTNVPRFQSLSKRVKIDHIPARGINHHGTLAQCGDLFFTY
ncbi:MAG: Uncharacterised protein [Halieaceae bacterium]|nr:MAG: Uncharacterised protein [Halieaceae bacterium]